VSDAPASPWVMASEPPSLGDPTNLVTLVDGQTFSLAGRSGDMGGSRAHGVYFADRRVLSELRLFVDGAPVEPLALSQGGATHATFVGRSVAPDGRATGHRLLVVRRRALGTVLHEKVELRNSAPVPVAVNLRLDAAVDFADVFAVKEGREATEGELSVAVLAESLLYQWRSGEMHRQAELRVVGGEPHFSPRSIAWEAVVPARGTFTFDLDLAVAVGSTWVERTDHHPDVPGAGRRAAAWLADAPTLRTADGRLASAFSRALVDVEALRLHDPAGRRQPVIAAGAPWFMTLFGRDALISSYMALPVDPTLAVAVLDALAELQGRRSDAASEEQPGRIMHETRFLGAEEPTLFGGHTYYGSVDATPLFVVLLGELSRWGLSDADLARLLPAADRALGWIDEWGDRDGDGYVEYQRSSEHGLVNQGWKDSWDGVRYRDGRIAEAPIALCEVQAYVYAARRARAVLARRVGDQAGAAHHDALASALFERFDRDFWLADAGWYAVGLGPDKQPIDSLTSNIGHLLWSGIVAPARAEQVAKRLLAEDMWTGWGVRTLSATDGGYDPMSYHCGTVWPHDTAILASGLRRYGLLGQAWTVVDGLLDASAALGGRLPELFCGFDRADVDTPVPFPTSCSPQAWAAATPFLLLRVVLGLEPDGRGGFTVDPIGSARTDDLSFSGVRLGAGRFDVRIDDGVASVGPSA
jgi:glycogen debranching enzyme